MCSTTNTPLGICWAGLILDVWFQGTKSKLWLALSKTEWGDFLLADPPPLSMSICCLWSITHLYLSYHVLSIITCQAVGCALCMPHIRAISSTVLLISYVRKGREGLRGKVTCQWLQSQGKAGPTHPPVCTRGNSSPSVKRFCKSVCDNSLNWL